MNVCVVRCPDGSYQVRVAELPDMCFGSLWEAMDFAYACEDGKAAGHGVAANGNR
jgi:hypothetical protein